jgi:hypothetical protein
VIFLEIVVSLYVSRTYNAEAGPISENSHM